MSQNAPAGGAFAIAPADTPIAQPIRALYVGGGGTLVVEMLSGGVVSFQNVPAGMVLPIRATRILPATTAEAIVGLY